ncbi:MAG: hypothetical protein R3A79_16580 [Nannocystaceae bacterium]
MGGLVRWLVAWPGAAAAALRSLASGAPRRYVALLRELRRAGSVRLVAYGDDDERILETHVFADGDVLIKVTRAGVGRWAEQRDALAALARDLQPPLGLVRALVPLALAPGVLWLAIDVLTIQGAAAFAYAAAATALPGLGLLVASWLLGRWIRLQLAADDG